MPHIFNSTPNRSSLGRRASQNSVPSLGSADTGLIRGPEYLLTLRFIKYLKQASKPKA